MDRNNMWLNLYMPQTPEDEQQLPLIFHFTAIAHASPFTQQTMPQEIDELPIIPNYEEIPMDIDPPSTPQMLDEMAGFLDERETQAHKENLQEVENLGEGVPPNFEDQDMQEVPELNQGLELQLNFDTTENTSSIPQFFGQLDFEMSQAIKVKKWIDESPELEEVQRSPQEHLNIDTFFDIWLDESILCQQQDIERLTPSPQQFNRSTGYIHYPTPDVQTTFQYPVIRTEDLNEFMISYGDESQISIPSDRPSTINIRPNFQRKEIWKVLEQFEEFVLQNRTIENTVNLTDEDIDMDYETTLTANEGVMEGVHLGARDVMLSSGRFEAVMISFIADGDLRPEPEIHRGKEENLHDFSDIVNLL